MNGFVHDSLSKDPARKVRLLFVSRFLAAEGVSGSDEYVAAVLQCLTDFGFEIDYLWLGYTPTHQVWHRFPSGVARAKRYLTPYLWRWSNYFAPRDTALWGWIVLKRLWNFSGRLPGLKNRKFFLEIGLALDRRLAIQETLFGRESLPRPVDHAAFQRVLREVQPEIILCNYYVLAALLSALPKSQVPQMVLTHYARDGNIAAECEAECLRGADLLLAIQQEDQVEFGRLYPEKESVLFTMPLFAKPRTGTSVAGRLLFVGGAHETNIEAVRWFLSDVWDKVLTSFPEATFHVCGSVCDLFRDVTFPGVQFLGRIENLDPEYEAAALVVVPLPGGTGLKIKLVQALQHGCAVVSTSAGLQGVDFMADRCVIRADSAAEFAHAVLHLLNDEQERKKMEQAALEVVEEFFSPKACVQPLLEWTERKQSPLPVHPASTLV